MGAYGLAGFNRRTRMLLAGLLCVALAAVVLVASGSGERAQAEVTLAAGFQEKTVLSGLEMPTNVEFAPDGSVYVAGSSGVFDSLTDPEPSVYADLRTQVYNHWDRGLLGMALDPKFAVNDKIDFAGTGMDGEDGDLTGVRLHWQTIMHHCPATCHQHVITGSEGGGGQFTAPDHENPSWVELRFTATDTDGQSDTKSVALYPQNSDITMASNPPGVPLTIFDKRAAAPYTAQVITGSYVSVAAPTTLQWINGQPHVFNGWSDGMASAHNFYAPAGNMTLTARYRRLPNFALQRPYGRRVWRAPARGRSRRSTATRPPESRSPST